VYIEERNVTQAWHDMASLFITHSKYGVISKHKAKVKLFGAVVTLVASA
jgi:hypothetical protein